MKILFVIQLMLMLIINGKNSNAQENTPAFPGAEGFGAYATGGRGGQVIYVTTLAPDGPGSLAEALSTPGPRYIVFTISGVIDAAAEVIYGDVTIAGQTSPGGIIVRGIVCDGHYDANDCDNLIIRHLRSRPAPHLENDKESYILDDGLRLDGVENVIVDHLSLANASDEAVQLSLAHNITIQNTIIAETVGEHTVFGGMLINYSHSQSPQDNLSIHHNLWYRINGRLPEISCELTRNIGSDDSPEIPSFCSPQPLNIEVSNNLLWDAGGAMTYNDNSSEEQGQPQAGIFTLNMNWVNNIMVVPDSYPFGMMTSHYIAQQGNQLYFSGNRMSIYPDYQDIELAYCCNDFNLYNPNQDLPAAQMLENRHPFPEISYIATDEVIPYMVQNAGAFPRDPMDRRYIDSVLSGILSNVPQDQAEANDAFMLDYDPLNPPDAPQDSDLDGMPDEWELANGLNPNIQDHNGVELSKQFTGIEGYTNLEVYLNWLADNLVNGN